MRTLKEIALEKQGYLTSDTLAELAIEYPFQNVVIKFEPTHRRIIISAIQAVILIEQLNLKCGVKEVFIPADELTEIRKISFPWETFKPKE